VPRAQWLSLESVPRGNHPGGSILAAKMAQFFAAINSYAGMLLTAVAEEVAERLAHLV